jgi:hypothetical protein
MVDMTKLRGQLVLLEQEALQTLEQVTTMEQLQVWRSLYILGQEPPPRKGALFSVFLRSEEVLDWTPSSAMPIAVELVDEAYARWRDQD